MVKVSSLSKPTFENCARLLTLVLDFDQWINFHHKNENKIWRMLDDRIYKSNKIL